MTIRDVAKLAGVSASTVSRCLNDSPLIPAETRDRVKGLATALNFQFNHSARSLTTKRCGTVGVVYPELHETGGDSTYLHLLFESVRRNLELLDFDSIFVPAQNKRTGRNNINRLIQQKKVDGFILILSCVEIEEWEPLMRCSFPIVQMHNRPANFDSSRFDFFFTDNFIGGSLVAKRLLSVGCKQLLCLSIDQHSPEMRDRRDGFRSVLAENGIVLAPGQTVDCECTFDAGYQAVMALGASVHLFDGIFAFADILALGAMRALQEQGIRVPQDMKIVGFDDTEFGALSFPALTSVHQPREAEAELACRRLAYLLSGGAASPVVQTFLEPTLVVRASC